MALRIYLSYYRRDAADEARRLYDALAERFGRENVFIGNAGADAVSSSDVLIVLIGRQWLDCVRADRPGLADLETVLAERRDVRVIPALVQGARMPYRDEVPGTLEPLTRLHAVKLADPGWEYGVVRLIDALERLIPQPVPSAPYAPERSRRNPFGRLIEAVARLARPVRKSAPPPEPQTQLPESTPPPAADAIVADALCDAAVAGIVPARNLGPEEDVVECTVFAPPAATPGDSILVQTFVYLPEQADDARAIATELDPDACRRVFASLTSPVAPGSRLDFELRLPGLEIDDPLASLVWRRRAEAVQFGVRIPADATPATVIGTLYVSRDSAPVGQVKFKLTIEPHAADVTSEPQGESASRYAVAFISYASEDRHKVLERVQVLSLVGIEYFHDILSLEPGDRWERRLELGIEQCDLFLLCWSSEAKRSDWVRKEVQYALARKAGDELNPPEIRPLILEGPPIVQPWDD